MSWSLGRRAPAPRLRLAARHLQRGQDRQAFDIFVKAAHAGDAEAAYQVGCGYLAGKVVPISFADAAHWLKRAAGERHVEAQAMLAELLLQGRAHLTDGDTSPRGLFASNVVGKPDFTAALDWSRRAAGGGSANGQALLAYILSRGPEPMRDLHAARDWYERAAHGGSAQGHLGYALAIADQAGREAETVSHLRHAADKNLPAAIYLLGVVTERGIGTAVDLPAAAQYYRKAAEAGHNAAQARWGAILTDGIGVPRDPQAGETWLRRAALGGDRDAAARVGQIYTTPGVLPPNYVEAASWFERAARGGHRGAAHALGLLYLSGTGVEPDTEAAAKWFRVAAAGGSAGAQNDLARLVLKGEGNDEDLASMLRWFKTDAEAGDHLAEFNYAVCLAKGLGGPRNDLEATRYLRGAARHVASARYWYGLMVAEGRGIPQNPAKARRHFELAVAAGQTEAAAALSEMLINGRGGPRDPERAFALFKQAADSKHVGAMFALGVVLTGGHGISADLPKAREWFFAAAKQNHAQARQVLSQFLTDGVGGDRDLEQARFWREDAPATDYAEASRVSRQDSRLDSSADPGASGANPTSEVDAETTVVAPAPSVAAPPMQREQPALPAMGSVASVVPDAASAPVSDTKAVPVISNLSAVPTPALPQGAGLPTPAQANGAAPPPPGSVGAPAPVARFIASPPAQPQGMASPSPGSIATPAPAARSVASPRMQPKLIRPSAPSAELVAPAAPAAESAPLLDPDWIVIAPATTIRSLPEQPGITHPVSIGKEPASTAAATQRTALAGKPYWTAIVPAASVVVPTGSVIRLPARPASGDPAGLAPSEPKTSVKPHVSIQALPLPARRATTFAMGATTFAMGAVAGAAILFLALGSLTSRRPEGWAGLANGWPWSRGLAVVAQAPGGSTLQSTTLPNGQSSVSPAAVPEPAPRVSAGAVASVGSPGAPAPSQLVAGARPSIEPPNVATAATNVVRQEKQDTTKDNAATSVEPPSSATAPIIEQATAPAHQLPRSDSSAPNGTPPLAKLTPMAVVAEAPVAVSEAPVALSAADPISARESLNSPGAETRSTMATILPAVTPSPPNPATLPASPEMAASLVQRGEAMLQRGDVLSARLFFERAGDQGSARGATGAGKTYDPDVLATIATGMKGDVARAVEWYRRASTELGDTEADERLKALTARYK